ncbi:MAG: DUF998 domain-containing protein [Euryarchaeota archaeon]|nr:DUF998 domain-containing protein [Euryarchaeota archaeon]MDE1836461.1 DUF998 domain-containing protein [Euryarchaeota archaeon]MDE1879024.1 DUF998 domain-containing protein [Euryarchaeota archaeon]MDE2044209.1 DUF998 domain-containing protein [Thermoplasmata archaeon]
MTFLELFRKYGYWTGPIAGVFAWVILLTLAALNPWWSITSQAFSYLGSSGTGHVDPWLYNVGMMLTGGMILIFAFYLLQVSRNRTQKLGSVHFVIAGMLLVGIGVWHQGPGPYPPGTSQSLGQDLHDLFSAWFFLQALLAGLTWGVGLRFERRFPIGLGMITSTFGAWSVAVFIAVAFGPLSGFYSAKPVIPHIVAEGGIVLGAVIAALGGLLALFVKRGTLREALGIFVLLIGAVLAGLGAMVGFGHVPGAVGEAIGILAIDVWVFIMYFAREARPFAPSTELPLGTLARGETTLFSTRRSLLHAFQVPAMALVLTGMFVFFYGNYDLTQKLVALLLGTIKISTFLAKDAPVILALYLGGYALVVLGAWRWSVALPRWVGAALLLIVITFPLVTVASWFDQAGAIALLTFFLIFGVLVPLTLSLYSWWRSRYALTDRRVLVLPEGSARDLSSLPRATISGLAVRRGLFHRWFDVGELTFSSLGDGQASARRVGHVEWVGVTGPQGMLEATEHELHLGVVRARRRKLRPTVLLMAAAIVVPVVLVATLVPAFTVLRSVELPCAFIFSDLQALEKDPWPYIHNTTLPYGHVSFQWWSGSDVYLLVGQLPVGIAYQNVPLNTSSGSLPTGLTSSGYGNYTSLGGDSFAACISLSSGATVTLVMSYQAPLIWA